MISRIKNLPGSRAEVVIELDQAELGLILEKTIKELSTEIEIQGFRKGKAPKEVLVNALGKEKIFQKSLERAINHGYKKAIKDSGLFPLGQPEVEVTNLPSFKLDSDENLKPGPNREKDKLIFRVSLNVLPKIELGEYKKIAEGLKRRKIEVKEDEIDKALEEIRKSKPKISQVLRPAKAGDLVEVEFWAESPALPKERDKFLLGSGRLIPGFEDQIINLAPGQEKEFILKVPLNHHLKNLAGKDVKFRVCLKQVQEVGLPELNDEFAKNLGRFDDLAHLKRSLKEGLRLGKEAKESRRTQEELLTLILGQTKMEIPEALLEKEKERGLKELKDGVQQELKITFEDYLKNIGKSEKEFSQDMQKSAKKRVAFLLIIAEIAKKENIRVPEEELNQEIKNYLNQSHFKTAKGNIDLEQVKSYLKERLTQKKVLELLESFTQRE